MVSSSCSSPLESAEMKGLHSPCFVADARSHETSASSLVRTSAAFHLWTMLNDSLPGLTIAQSLSTTEKASFLSLPNETLLQIIQAFVGEPTLSLPRYRSPRNEAIHTIRLVNQRLAALGSYYVRFRHKCLSERQLEYEANHLKEDEILKRRYTR